jgi:hypothetical protein
MMKTTRNRRINARPAPDRFRLGGERTSATFRLGGSKPDNRP